jgi:hypothetical protein
VHGDFDVVGRCVHISAALCDARGGVNTFRKCV